ncbi:MAG: hypothetical protein ACK56F_27735 [bacterium]
MDNIVESKVQLTLQKEREELARIKEDNQMLLRKIELIEAERESDRQKERQLQDKINGLTQDL